MKAGMKKRTVLLGVCAILAFSGCGNKQIEKQYEKAAAALEAGDYAEAADSFTAITQSEEMLAEAYRGLGIAELNQGNYAEASIAFSKSLLYLETDNKEFEKDVKSYLAISRTKRMEYEEAIKIYDELLQEYKEAEYYYLRGKCYIQMQNYDMAKQDFDEAAKRSTDSNLFINIYEIYNDLQMNADGSAYLEQGLTLVDADDHYSRGLIYYYLQEYSNAKEALISAVNKNHSDEAMLLLGKVYLAMEDIASARAMYQEYVDDSDVAAEAYNGLALCDIEQGNYDNALANIQKGLALADENAEKSLLFNEICIYEYLYDWPNARTKVAEYLAKYPDDEEVLREQQFLNH